MDELDAAQIEARMNVNAVVMQQAIEVARAKARETYGIADRAAVGRCIVEHLDDAEREDLRARDWYHCPKCGTLLKDRRRSVGSTGVVSAAIHGERRRIREAWQAVVEAEDTEGQHEAMRRFLRALGE